MRVKDQYHTWREGESLLFDDSFNHEVINKSMGSG
jgi:aspartyl/asparaginyl beta-hydroxylase (cupin superfamily)